MWVTEQAAVIFFTGASVFNNRHMCRFQKSHLPHLLIKTSPKRLQSQQNTRVTGTPDHTPWLVSLDWNIWQTSRSTGRTFFRLQKHTPPDWCDWGSMSQAKIQPRIFSQQHAQRWRHVWHKCAAAGLALDTILSLGSLSEI